MKRANCRGVLPVLMFPEKNKPVTAADAKAVCAGCVVRDECLRHALEHGERFGVWGGLTERERRKLARQRRQAS